MTTDEPTRTNRAAWRRFTFGMGCFVTAWALSGAIEHWATNWLVGVPLGAGILLAAMLAIAWLSDRRWWDSHDGDAP